MATASQAISHTRLKIEKVAVLVDFSKTADTALRFAAALAREHKAGIVLAHAYLPPSSALSAPRIELTYEALDHWREGLRLSLLKQTEAIYLRDIHCTILLREGSPSDLLRDLGDADLIVVGTSGETGFRKATLGSTAEVIFRSSAVPVLTVGPHCDPSGRGEIALDTVLYATDFSAGADAALSYALSIAREHGAKLVLLHVEESNDMPFSFDRAMASAEPLEKLRHLVPDGISLRHKPVYVVGFGAPDALILEEAKNREANIIVVGARGAGAFSGAVSHFGGGTAYKVAANADCPVLTVRKV